MIHTTCSKLLPNDSKNPDFLPPSNYPQTLHNSSLAQNRSHAVHSVKGGAQTTAKSSLRQFIKQLACKQLMHGYYCIYPICQTVACRRDGPEIWPILGAWVTFLGQRSWSISLSAGPADARRWKRAAVGGAHKFPAGRVSTATHPILRSQMVKLAGASLFFAFWTL